MNTKHTPGPWVASRSANAAFTRHPAIISDTGEVAMATWAGNERQTDANARLIAAAPELLSALQKIDANAAESVEWIRRVAQEAIAKATGGAA